MISHELKCIFIHIPRTGGSSIEQALIKQDWWKVDPTTKHLFASQARKIYADYWDDYFKFSFVRNPYSRMLSIANWRLMSNMYYGKRPVNEMLSSEHIEHYKKTFGHPVLLEYDYRFYKRKEIENDIHKDNCVYENILDEPIDYIGKLETIEKDLNNICTILGKKGTTLLKIGSRIKHENILSLETKLRINEIYDTDFLKFSYNKEYI